MNVIFIHLYNVMYMATIYSNTLSGDVVTRPHTPKKQSLYVQCYKQWLSRQSMLQQ